MTHFYCLGFAWNVLVWRNSISLASTGPIFRQSKIETFETTVSWHSGRRRCLTKMCRNDRQCDRKRLLAVIYTSVEVGGRIFLSSASVLSISTIFRLNISFAPFHPTSNRPSYQCCIGVLVPPLTLSPPPYLLNPPLPFDIDTVSKSS